MTLLNIFTRKTTAPAAAPVEIIKPAPANPEPAVNETPSFKPFRSFELKIKAKSLAAEIRMIHQEEIKLKAAARKATNFPQTQQEYRDAFWSLRNHRDGLKPLVRDTNLAYGFLRGKTFLQIEPQRFSEPNWSEIERMILKYGARIGDNKLKSSFQHWKQAAGKALPESERQERKRLAAAARKQKKAAA